VQPATGCSRFSVYGAIGNPEKGNLPLGRAQSHRVQYAGVGRVWIAGLPKGSGGAALFLQRHRRTQGFRDRVVHEPARNRRCRSTVVGEEGADSSKLSDLVVHSQTRGGAE
jgi:hypothetical protein